MTKHNKLRLLRVLGATIKLSADQKAEQLVYEIGAVISEEDMQRLLEDVRRKPNGRQMRHLLQEYIIRLLEDVIREAV